MFRKMPFLLVFIILAIVFLDPILPLSLKEVLYSISITIKSLIIFFLPFIIFGLLFKASVILSSNATKVIGTILLLVCCSNFCSTFLSHYLGIWIYNFDISLLIPKDTGGLTTLWTLKLPQLIANDKSMLAGICLGLLACKLWPQKSLIFALKIENIITKLLTSFVYLIPFFVAGFVVKLQHDGIISLIIKDYTVVFILIALAQFSYIFLSYLLLNKFSIKDFFYNIKNMLPAAISGFTTMSSAASMPLTIIGAQANAKNKDIARSVIPATVNIHLVGDCFAIPIFAYAVLKSFGIPEPSLINYLVFAVYFVLAKFSAAAIPGGGILVMLPILEAYLGFNAEMMSLITALYILFDPVITCANVLGNGAFAKMIDNIFAYFKPVDMSTKTLSD
jgi:hypothetical protein